LRGRGNCVERTLSRHQSGASIVGRSRRHKAECGCPVGRASRDARRNRAGCRRGHGAQPTPSKPAGLTQALPKIAEKANDLEAIKKAVEDAAAVSGALWFSYLFVLSYLAIAAGAVTHADLFFENPVKLPFLNVELPLIAFFFLAPILFLVMHAYTLVHLVMLTDKAKRFDAVLRKQIGDKNEALRDRLRRQLPSDIFVQFLAGPKDISKARFGWLLRVIAWSTLVVAPALLLLLMQIQFLPFHNSFITWTHRIVLVGDLALLWWLWRKILSGRRIGARRERLPMAWTGVGIVLSLVAVLFSWTAATFPGEQQEELLAKWDKSGLAMSILNWVFNSEVDPTTRRRWLPISSTLVLPGLNVYEGLKIDDPEKAKWRDFVFRARGRDLNGAIFDLAILPKVDFEGAHLQGAVLNDAELQGAVLNDAQLQGASLNRAELHGVSLDGAELQAASLDGAHLQGASLDRAELRGASLVGAKLQGASLIGAKLQGASLDAAQLQGASLDGARLEGAVLDDTQLQGASLFGTKLQGASMQRASLQAADLTGAVLWRTTGNSAHLAVVKPTGAPDDGKSQPWNDANYQTWNDTNYQDLRRKMKALPFGDRRDRALARIQSLDCANPDPKLASCDPLIPLLSEAAAGSKVLEEDARADNAAYKTVLVAELKALICSGDNVAADILRRLLVVPGGRIEAAGLEAPKLIDDIMSKDCRSPPR
jgi:uncharacterized protein YjbI with pentapeptide repeats